jgi:hypothetical protein
MKLSSTNVVARTTSLLSTPADGWLVLLNPERDSFIGLDSVAKEVWALMESPSSVEEICRRMSEQFDATPEQIEADVVPFLSALHDEGLIRVIS